jgi:pimeloyl-ACP methyl ester carboxylesterase
MAWFPQIPVFSKHFRLLLLDNRGAGRTDKPEGPYSVKQMAADTNGLLAALDIRRTALLGVSMGGMIAQELAIDHPEKLSCLILACTSFGGPESIRASQEILNALSAGSNADEEARRLQEQALFCDETILNRRDVIAAYAAARSKFPITRNSLQWQRDALRTHDAASRLGRIQAPTLIMTGIEDRLVPARNSHLMASRIPGAVLEELPGGHAFMIEYPEVFNRSVIEFMKSRA